MRKKKGYFAIIMFNKLIDEQKTNRKSWNI